MHCLGYPKTKVVGRLIAATRCLAVIAVLACCACGQTQLKVTAEPTAVTDAAKPNDVVLHVTNNGSIDQTLPTQLGTVKVGDASAVIKSTDAAKGTVTITPPPNLAGTQKVQLFDKNNRILGDTQLQYPGQSATATTAEPTPGPIEIRQNSLSQSWWFRAAVILLFGLVVGIFVYTLYRVIRFSRSSFRNPLGFPVGSFRAMLAFTLVAFLSFYVMTSVLSISEFS